MSSKKSKDSEENNPKEWGEIENLLKQAERITEENLKKGKSPQSAITIACISLGINPNPLEENYILDHLWQKMYQELDPENFM
jgi:hypothetical protein